MRDKRKKLKICLQLLRHFPPLVGRERLRIVQQCKRTLLKSPKSAVLHCGIFELGTVLLPLSSWLPQLPNVTSSQLLEPTRRSFKEKICPCSVAMPFVSCRFCPTQPPAMFERSWYAKWKDQTRGHSGFFTVWPSTPAGQRSPSLPENKLTNRCLVSQD